MEATKMKTTYDFTTMRGRALFNAENGSGMYSSKNEDGEDVIIFRTQGDGYELHTFQSNGWLRVNYYNEAGYNDGETFRGRWEA